ncbi:hypothetical protein GpartN1_g1401.t1 [Galdieria partita]|uniref:Major facilitator superfamily (MFS) profile domain-containing protein n=1 Tax=Galdieria partita TaxID=83374 RepID=A0A9C7UNK2_9RHOD|nr:hypothetical protein GpartN1_g1401.t1 [Galdieria partita]
MADNVVQSTVVSLAFVLFLLFDVGLNLDSGVIPVYLYAISDQFKLSRFSQGVLGSLSPAGFAVSTIVCSYVLRHYSPKAVLILCLFMAVVANLTFALSTNWFLFYSSRFLFGAFLAAFFIYVPVWTDEFAPSRFRTRWIGLVQACAPLGVILGFIFSGLLIDYQLSWRLAIIFQSGIVLLCVIGLCLCPRRFIDIEEDRVYPSMVPKTPEFSSLGSSTRLKWRTDIGSPYTSFVEPRNSIGGHSKRCLSLDDAEDNSISPMLLGNGRVAEETSCLLDNANDSSSHDIRDDFSNSRLLSFATVSSNNFARGLYAIEQSLNYAASGIYCFWKELSILISNRLWFCCCLTLAFLFFTIEGIRYWVVVYRQEVYLDGLSNIVLVYVIVSVTAPITGVLVGGHLIDSLGGYKQPEALSRSLEVICLFGFLAFIPAWICVLKSFSNLLFFGISLWLIIFFGAAMVAPLTGIMVSVVSYEHRSVSSAMSLLINHIFGYFAAPLVTGSISQLYGIRIGFPCILLLGSLSLLFVIFGLVYNYRQLKSFHSQENPTNQPCHNWMTS